MSTNITNSKNFLTILNLSSSREDWEEICSDATATGATKVAQDVLSQLQATDYKADKINIFIQKLELLNSKFLEFTHQSPLVTVIQGLKERQLNTSPTSVKRLQALFESTASPASERSEKKEMLSVQTSLNHPQEKLFERFQENIRKLDLASPLLSQKTEEIKQDLKKLENMNLFSNVESYAISGLLDALKKGNTLFLHLPGDELFNLLSKSHPDLKINYQQYEDSKKITHEQAQSDLLKIFKANCDSSRKLSEALQPAYKQFLNQIYQMRLSYALTSDHLKLGYFNQHFMTNFSQLANLFEKFTLEISSELVSPEIEKIIDACNNRSSGGFLKLIKYYSYLDLKLQSNEIIQTLQSSFVKILDLKKINETKPQFLDILADSYLMQSKQAALKLFKELYEKYFQVEHQWLADYAHCIKKPYNQADDPESPGPGCCFNNSLDRFKIISGSPHLLGKDIPMKSSKEGRFSQVRAIQAFHQRSLGMLSPLEAENIQASSAKRLGIKLSKKIIIPSSPQKDPKQNLVDETTEVYKNNPQIQFILILRGPENMHALNIQFDASKNIFRFMDDNLGVCEFATFFDFQKGFLSYLNAFYSDKNQFQFRFFEKE